MNIQNYKSALRLIGLLSIGAIASGCNSTSLTDLTAGSTHNSNQLPQISTGQKTPPAAPLVASMASQNGAGTTKPIAYGQADNQQGNQRAIVDSSGAPKTLGSGALPGIAPSVTSATTDQTQMSSLNPDDASMRTDAMAYADPNSPENLAQQRIDQLYPSMTHAACKGGWATPPDSLDAKRVKVGHRYYMEMRLRNTPLLPVGHTYIAYGRMGEDGSLLDENVVMLSPIGGYGGAAVAAALPMPGILKPVPDDCRIKPHAAYRVSLSAEQFEQLLLRIQKAQKKIPAYALFAYNCNHFASDIAASVGILPPKNIYLPAVKYIYGVIEANEGFNPKKTKRG